VGVEFLHRPEGRDGEFDFSAVNRGRRNPPAFGVPVGTRAGARHRLRVVDTTCGSVLNVWNGESRARRLHALIHGKNYPKRRRHVEPGEQVSRGKYIVVRDMNEARRLRVHRGTGTREEFWSIKEDDTSFDPDRDSAGRRRIRQMLSGESLHRRRVGGGMARRWA